MALLKNVRITECIVSKACLEEAGLFVQIAHCTCKYSSSGEHTYHINSERASAEQMSDLVITLIN